MCGQEVSYPPLRNPFANLLTLLVRNQLKVAALQLRTDDSSVFLIDNALHESRKRLKKGLGKDMKEKELR